MDNNKELDAMANNLVKKRMMEEFRSLCEPINEWLNKNYDSYTMVVIQQGSAQLFGGEMGIRLPVND